MRTRKYEPDHTNSHTASLAQLKAILAVDLKKAFDGGDHDAILLKLAASNCGPRLYNYVRDYEDDLS